MRAGQHVNLTVEVNGRRQTRCYSPANAEGDRLIELTIGLHDDGLVSEYLFRNARPGMVVGLEGLGGDFTLPAVRPRRVLFVSGGSGITPVLSMLRSMRDEGSDREITFIHYARTPQEACYRAELATMPGVRVLHGYSRSPEAGDLTGYFSAEHVADLDPELLGDDTAVFVCGPPALVEAVRAHYPGRQLRELRPRRCSPYRRRASGGTVAFADSGVERD